MICHISYVVRFVNKDFGYCNRMFSGSGEGVTVRQIYV